MSKKIFGYDFADIQRAQQKRGSLSERVDTSKSNDVSVNQLDADLALLELHGMAGLLKMQYHGVIDRLKRASRVNPAKKKSIRAPSRIIAHHGEGAVMTKIQIQIQNLPTGEIMKLMQFQAGNKVLMRALVSEIHARSFTSEGKAREWRAGNMPDNLRDKAPVDLVRKNPAKKKSIHASSRITGKKPTARLVARRKKPSVKGYFPNPGASENKVPARKNPVQKKRVNMPRKASLEGQLFWNWYVFEQLPSGTLRVIEPGYMSKPGAAMKAEDLDEQTGKQYGVVSATWIRSQRRV